MIFTLIDHETTGLTSHYQSDLRLQPRSIEFALVKTDGKEILDKLDFISNPGFDVEQIITDITGLTNDELAEAAPFKTRIDDVAKFFVGSDAVIAHNLSFDRMITEIELRHQGLTLADINWPKLEICAVEQTYDQFGRRMKLEDLYNIYCGEYVQKHRALDDVMLMHELCGKLGVYSMFKEAA